jgi:tetratricopeptide (TPR) repeat protein
MFRTFIKKAATLAGLMALLAFAASAQTTQIEGNVKQKAADGTLKPVANALIDLYRTDVAGHWNVKSDKNGHFIRLGIPVQGTYLFVVSAPECQPTWANNIRVGQVPSLDFVLNPGDGAVPTYDQVMASLKSGTASPTTSAPSAGDKAKSDAAAKERDTKVKEAQALQTARDEAIKHFKTGVELREAKNYQGALTEFEQAAAIDPGKHQSFIEVAHKATLQLSETHYNVGAEMFNNKDKAGAKPHFEKAYETAKKAIDIAATESTDPNINNQLLVYYGLLGRDAALLVEMYGETDLIDDVVKSLDKAAAIDTPANKGKWDVLKAKMYFNAGRTDEAVAAYKAVLTTDAANVDALFGLGLALVATGEKAKIQEGVNYLADFVAKAPPTDKRVADVKSQLEDLKKQQQVEPEKPAKRRKP